MSSAENPLDLVEFVPVVLGRDENRGARRSSLFRPAEASSAAMEGWGSMRGLARTRGWSRKVGRGPEAARPRACIDGDGGGGAPAVSAADRDGECEHEA
jgi:hypothetical protein